MALVFQLSRRMTRLVSNEYTSLQIEEYKEQASGDDNIP